MKRLIIMLSLIGLVITSARAQLGIGVRVGADFTILGGDPGVLTKSVGSGGMGAEGDYFFFPEVSVFYRFQNNLSINVGAQYRTLGYDFSGGVSNPGDLHMEYHYIMFPVYVSWNYYLTPRVYIGPDAGVAFGVYKDILFTNDGKDNSSLQNNKCNPDEFYPMGMLGLHVGFEIYNGLSFELAANYNYAFCTPENSLTASQREVLKNDLINEDAYSDAAFANITADRNGKFHAVSVTIGIKYLIRNKCK